MILLNVSLKNYKSFPDYEQTIPLNHIGTKLIVASNGSGKTTIFDSIIWCLYGKTVQDSVDDVVNRYIKKDCKVSVNFEINGEIYSVYRYRNHSTHGNALYLFNESKNLSLKNISDTQQLIQDIIQIPYNTMVNSVIFSTETYTSFFKAKPSERIKIIENILSLKEIVLLYEENKKIISSLENKKNEKEKEINKIVSAEETLTEANESYKTSVKNTLMQLKKEKEECEIRKNNINKKIEEYKTIDIEKELLLLDINEKNKLIQIEIREEQKKLTDEKLIEQEIEKIKKQLLNLSSIDIEKELKILEENRKLNDEILFKENKKQLKAACLIDNNSFKERLKNIVKEIEDKQKELKILEDNHCHVCGQSLTKEKNKELFTSKTLEIEKNKNEINDIKSSIEKNEETNSFLNTEISSLSEEIKDLSRKFIKSSYTEIYLNSVKEEINKLKTTLAVKENEIVNIKKFNEEINNKINKLKNELIETKASIYNKDFLISLKEKINLLEKENNELNIKIISIETTAKNTFDKSFIEENDKKLKVLKKAFVKEQKDLNEINEELKYYQILSAVFSNKEAGFKKYFIGKMINVFNKNINFYLPFFFDKDINIQLDKDLNEKIIYDENLVSFSSFSSGQKTRVEIATSFALFNLVKVFFSNETNLIVMDELLDKHIDAEGFNSVVEVVEGLAKENSIFIVSHRDELKERFNDKIEIKLDEGRFSRVIL